MLGSFFKNILWNQNYIRRPAIQQNFCLQRCFKLFKSEAQSFIFSKKLILENLVLANNRHEIEIEIASVRKSLNRVGLEYIFL